VQTLELFQRSRWNPPAAADPYGADGAGSAQRSDRFRSDLQLRCNLLGSEQVLQGNILNWRRESRDLHGVHLRPFVGGARLQSERDISNSDLIEVMLRNSIQPDRDAGVTEG
jgi:hypothetical protein